MELNKCPKNFFSTIVACKYFSFLEGEGIGFL